MKGNILAQLKEIIYAFVDSEGRILDKPKPYTINTIKLNKRRNDFIRQFIDLLLNTKFITNESKIYLLNKNYTMRNVHEEIQKLGSRIAYRTVTAKLYYDSTKIASVFTSKMLTEILFYDKANMDMYEEALADVLNKYSNKKILHENIGLKLPKTKLNNSLSDDEFNDFLQIIKPYLKSQINFIYDNINKRSIGYAEYLLSSTLLSDIQKEQKNLLLECLVGD
ncbi:MULTISPECIES: hypothetical protein [Clostridium]|uniref:Uncharacterized protein n=1 Tax=Clostridium frigoriphilum TaxID=443253 RepID=A0ABU7UX64_9CLOT|nr:hypothetical protein [Clostridium sp. DSM 17811]MBU3101909.1 hypothetical protein [Clostridium sp. DSM 17811]